MGNALRVHAATNKNPYLELSQKSKELKDEWWGRWDSEEYQEKKRKIDKARKRDIGGQKSLKLQVKTM
jgi:hypothetical protein